MKSEDISPYINKLPEPYSEMLRLFYKEELSLKDIAQKLGISLYSVKNCINKALYLIKIANGDPDLIEARAILYQRV